MGSEQKLRRKGDLVQAAFIRDMERMRTSVTELIRSMWDAQNERLAGTDTVVEVLVALQ